MALDFTVQKDALTCVRLYTSKNIGCDYLISTTTTGSICSTGNYQPFTWNPAEHSGYTLFRWVPPIHMIHQQTDLPSSSTTSSHTVTTNSATARSTGDSGAPTSAGTNTTTSNSGALSTSGKIEIGVVIPVVVIALILLGYFLIRRRKHRQKTSTNTTHDPAHDTVDQLAQIRRTIPGKDDDRGIKNLPSGNDVASAELGWETAVHETHGESKKPELPDTGIFEGPDTSRSEAPDTGRREAPDTSRSEVADTSGRELEDTGISELRYSTLPRS